ncbi:MAG: nicotinate (nicotinamide) nucleotide adenylyltransferase [Ruminococcaceae bacterium]|nr:nicotinate (nicotinamide) nucleotide adenylyltransferase [Oscillospiraceae bacterium]
MANIAVFGGTFNPIHSQHIKMIKCISQLEFIDSVIVMPTNIPPHKSTTFLADGIDRYNMCSIATREIKNVTVSDFEIKRQEKSYTFYTVKALKEKYKNDKLFIVCGGDMAITLNTWFNYEELKKTCSFLVINRPGTDKNKLKAYLDSLRNGGADITEVLCETLDVSSTKVRNEQDLTEVPVEVLHYIKEKGLYTNG